MPSKQTLESALRLINSELNGQMTVSINDLISQDDTFRAGTKAAGPRARKASTEWGKAVTGRLKELREAKKLLAQYRKETIEESK